MELAASKSPVSQALAPSSPASQTLGRGLDVLEQVAAGPVALGVIATRLGLSRSTVHRLATSLLERRYLTLAPRRGYSLGPKLLELGSVARGQDSLVRAARPIMEMLADATGDAVLLAVREADTVVLADSVPGNRRLAPRLRVGERQNLVRATAGRALLLDATEAELTALWNRLADGSAADFLGSIRRGVEAGIVVDEAHADPEIGSLAAPVRSADGTIRGAIGVATAAPYKEVGLAPAAQDALRRAAAALSQELGWLVSDMHGALPEADADPERDAPGNDRRRRPAAAGYAGKPVRRQTSAPDAGE